MVLRVYKVMAVWHNSKLIIKTKFAKKVKELEVASPQEAEEILVGSLRKAVVDGNIDEGSFMAGQSSGLINEIKPVRGIIEEILIEFKETIKKLREDYL